MTTTIMHISDLHFGKHFVDQVAVALQRSGVELQPDITVVSGDLTQRARQAEFDAACAYIQQFAGAHKIVVPGNHDLPLYRVWERLTRPRQRYQASCGQLGPDTLHTDEVSIIGLDSTDYAWRALVNGHLSASQLQVCRQFFSESNATQLRIAVMHHHLIPAPSFNPNAPIRKARRTLDVLTEARVNLVLAGHLHRAYIGNTLDVYAGEDRSHGIIVVQCGTSTSRRGRGMEREKNTFNYIEIHADSINVQHYIYFSADGHFRPESEHIFQRRDTRAQ